PMAEKKRLRNRKPFQLLACMSDYEVDQFTAFLDTSWSQAGDRLIRFFALCRDQTVWKSDLSKEELDAISPVFYSDGGFNKLTSALDDELSRFLALGELLDSPREIRLLEMLAISQREMEKNEFEKRWLYAVRKIKQGPPDAQRFRIELELELIKARHNRTRRVAPEVRNLGHLHHSLDQFYYIQKLRFLCAEVNEATIFDKATTHERPLPNWLHEKFDQFNDVAKAHFHVYHVLKQIRPEHHYVAFKKILQSIPKETPKTDFEELQDLYGYLLNHYMRRLNAGETDLISNLHEVYAQCLADGYLLENDKISPENFKNLLKLKLRLGLHREAQDFFDEFISGDRLTDTQQGAIADYSGLLIKFYSGRFKATIDQTERLIGNKGRFKDDQFYGLDVRALLLIAYYSRMKDCHFREWDQSDERVQDLLKSFGPFIDRKKVSEGMRTDFQNFRAMFQKLYQHRYGKANKMTQERLEAFLQTLKAASNLPNKDWFVREAIECRDQL
ncbi:MAG: hypothetical protein AAGN35_14210, partial [Bacteroidota bacterium]